MKPFLGLLLGLLMAVSNARSVADENLQLPKSLPPLPVAANMTKDGKLVLRMQVQGRASSTAKSRNNANEKSSGQASAWHEETYALDVREVKVYDVAGKEVDAKTLPMLLVKETLGLYSYAVKVDPLHLRTMKQDTLIFVYLPSASKKLIEPAKPVPGLADFLKKQGYVAIPLVQLWDRLGIRVKVKGKELMLGVDTGASNVCFDQNRVKHLGLPWNSSGYCQIDELEVGGIKFGPLQVKTFDMTESNEFFQAADLPLADGLLGADILRPLSAVIDEAGYMLYLRKTETKK